MVKDVERYLSDMAEMGIEDKKHLEEKEAYYAVSMVVFAVMNRVIDMGNEVISGSANIPVPGTYAETFELLARNNVISPATATEMTRLMKYRNIIAHEYYRLSTDELFRLKKDVVHAETFIDEIKKYLKR